VPFFYRGIAQSGSAPALGAGCQEFESPYPDHFQKKDILMDVFFFALASRNQYEEWGCSSPGEHARTRCYFVCARAVNGHCWVSSAVYVREGAFLGFWLIVLR
jgi:hypothetical protein